MGDAAGGDADGGEGRRECAEDGEDDGHGGPGRWRLAMYH